MVIDLSSVLGPYVDVIKIALTALLTQMFNDLYLKYDVKDIRSRMVEAAAAGSTVDVNISDGSISAAVNMAASYKSMLADAPWVDAGEIEADMQSVEQNFNIIAPSVFEQQIQNYIGLDAAREAIAKQIEPEIAKMIQSSLGGT
jgi:hypothetical protein